MPDLFAAHIRKIVTVATVALILILILLITSFAL